VSAAEDILESEFIFSLLPYSPDPDEIGPFHRLQCAHVNEKMCVSGRIGGDRSYGHGFRRVHAYVDHLPEGEEGIEFWTRVPRDSGTPPHLAYWTEDSPGVTPLDAGDRQLVAINATIVKRVDGHAHCRCKR
jgi:hypothetical protein